jgi:hypothetical protein
MDMQNIRVTRPKLQIVEMEGRNYLLVDPEYLTQTTLQGLFKNVIGK